MNPQTSTSCRQDDPRTGSHAFTLLEVLVAVTVLGLLVVLLMGLVDSATKLWRANENRVETYREARVALNMIASELRSIVPSTNSAYFFLENSNNNEDSKIGFLSAMPLSSQDADSKSEVCAVGYFLAEGNLSDLDSSSEKTWNLYRYFLESNQTRERLLGDASAPNLWPATEMVPGDIRTEILARNVVSFKLRAYLWNSTASAWETWVPSTQSPTPDLVEIEIEAVNSDSSRRSGGEIKSALPDTTGSEIRKLATRFSIPKVQIVEP